MHLRPLLAGRDRPGRRRSGSRRARRAWRRTVASSPTPTQCGSAASWCVAAGARRGRTRPRRPSTDAGRLALRPVFEAPASRRSAGVPLALSSTLHAGLVAVAVFIATLQPVAARGHAQARRPPGRSDAARVHRDARSGRRRRRRRAAAEGAAAKALREGRRAVSSPLPVRREPKPIEPVPAPPEPQARAARRPSRCRPWSRRSSRRRPIRGTASACSSRRRRNREPRTGQRRRRRNRHRHRPRRRRRQRRRTGLRRRHRRRTLSARQRDRTAAPAARGEGRLHRGRPAARHRGRRRPRDRRAPRRIGRRRQDSPGARRRA